jgi:GDP-mannose pyrophosphatase NudK
MAVVSSPWSQREQRLLVPDSRVTPGSKTVHRRLLAMRTVGETVQIRNIQTRVQSKKGKLMSVSYAQRRRDGDQQQRKRDIYDSGNSAVILPYDPARKTVLLTRQLRLPIFLQDGKENALEACAGKLDGATAEERIRKEIEEELGYRIVEVERLFELYVSPASIMEKVFFFTCSYSPAQKISSGGGLKEEGEDIEIVEITLENAANMIATGEIIDAKTVVLIQYLSERVRTPKSL